MAKLAKYWTGYLFGTNTGKIFLELDHDENTKIVKGEARFNDDVTGIVIYDFTGSFDDALIIKCVPRIEKDTTVRYGDIEVTGTLKPNDIFMGTWESTIGTAGTFELYPHEQEVTDKELQARDLTPTEIHKRVIQVGAVRLFKKDIHELVNNAIKDFDEPGKAIINYIKLGDTKVTKYVDDFIKENFSGDLKFFSLFNSDKFQKGGEKRSVAIDLNEFGNSEIRVSGFDEWWVHGKADVLEKFLKNYQRGLITTYRRHGLVLNQLLFFGMLVSLPEISRLIARIGFVVFVIILLTGLVQVHRKFIPNTLIFMVDREVTWFNKYRSSIASFVLTVIAGLLVGFVYDILGKFGIIQSIVNFLSK